VADKSDVAIPAERIERAILLIRGQKVMLDADLAAMYGVTTGNLNKAVSRNQERFPSDFMFRLTHDEGASLRFQSGTSKSRGGRRPAIFPDGWEDAHGKRTRYDIGNLRTRT